MNNRRSQEKLVPSPLFWLGPVVGFAQTVEREFWRGAGVLGGGVDSMIENVKMLMCPSFSEPWLRQW